MDFAAPVLQHLLIFGLDCFVDPSLARQTKRSKVRRSTLAAKDVKELQDLASTLQAVANEADDDGLKRAAALKRQQQQQNATAMRQRIRRTSLATAYAIEAHKSDEALEEIPGPMYATDGADSNVQRDRWKRTHRKSVKYVPKANVLYSGPPKKLVSALLGVLGAVQRLTRAIDELCCR